MSFVVCQTLAVVASFWLTRRRGIDTWSRFFWGLLAGIGLWLVWLRFGGGA